MTGHVARSVSVATRPGVHFVHHGETLLITDGAGWVRRSMQGLFHRNTRYLSRDEIRLEGGDLLPNGVSPVDADALLAYLYVPRSGAKDDRRWFLVAQRFVDGGMGTTIRLENRDVERAWDARLAWAMEADFADLAALQEGEAPEASAEGAWDEERRELRFHSEHPELERGVLVRLEETADGASVAWRDGALRIAASLASGTSATVRASVIPLVDGEERAPTRHSFAGSSWQAPSARERLLGDAPELVTSNVTVANAWRTAARDLSALALELPDGPATPAAGLPLFHEFYGRDGLTIAWQALMAMPAMMRDVLRAAAHRRGRRIDDFFDEEPGKLFNHVSRSPRSVLREDPFLHYHGDYAAGPDFLIGFGQYLAWSDDRDAARALLPALRDVLAWTERYADLDGDRLIEYVQRSDASDAVKNQGWKDSPQAIIDADGRIVPNPIASCELQGYLYAGLRQTAQAFLVLGERGYALELLARARRLARRFDEAFWMEDEGTYALALGPDKEQVRSVTSNPGHLLATGIVPPHRAGRVVRRLMRSDMFSGWGIRTLSSDHPAYNPFGYHLGTVWPVESATIAVGMARYGFRREALRLAEATFAASELFAERRLPEAFGGHPRDEEHPHPGVYPGSNAPQGWSASAIVLLVQVLLGLRPFAPLRAAAIDPYLPPWLQDIEMRGIRVGDARLDVRAWRDGRGRTRMGSRTHGRPLLVLRRGLG